MALVAFMGKFFGNFCLKILGYYWNGAYLTYDTMVGEILYIFLLVGLDGESRGRYSRASSAIFDSCRFFSFPGISTLTLTFLLFTRSSYALTWFSR